MKERAINEMRELLNKAMTEYPNKEDALKSILLYVIKTTFDISNRITLNAYYNDSSKNYIQLFEINLKLTTLLETVIKDNEIEVIITQLTSLLEHLSQYDSDILKTINAKVSEIYESNFS